jgi:hypothetical protein
MTAGTAAITAGTAVRAARPLPEAAERLPAAVPAPYWKVAPPIGSITIVMKLLTLKASTHVSL